MKSRNYAWECLERRQSTPPPSKTMQCMQRQVLLPRPWRLVLPATLRTVDIHSSQWFWKGRQRPSRQRQAARPPVTLLVQAEPLRQVTQRVNAVCRLRLAAVSVQTDFSVSFRPTPPGRVVLGKAFF